MIIDAHVHLPVCNEGHLLQRQKERLLHEMKENRISHCIVISDSSMESIIGTMDECVELFAETDNVDVVGGISPFFEFQTQLLKLKEYLDKNRLWGLNCLLGMKHFILQMKD